MRKHRFTRRQRMTILSAIMTLVIVIVVLQLWLFTATVNMYLGGNTGILLPATLVSALCFALNAGLLWYLYGLER